MTLLAIQLPPRDRAGTGRGPTEPREWPFAFSRDLQTVEVEGTGTPASWPSADRVVLVARDQDVNWLSARLPRVAGGRLREALVGLLEDRLLEEPSESHLAVGRPAPSDGCTWIAAMNRRWLDGTLADLASAGVAVDAVVAASEPSVHPVAHARVSASGEMECIFQGPEGVLTWPGSGLGLKARAAATDAWTVEPAAAQALRDQIGLQPPLLSAHERLLRAAVSGTNLLQLDLAPKRRASRWAWGAWAELRQARWRALHIGVAVWAVLQVVGLNLQARSLRHELQALDSRAASVLQSTFPTVKVVVDPVVQMQRELQTLREIDGMAGPSDLESWLDVLAAQWLPEAGPLRAVRWDAQGLVVEAERWPAPLTEALTRHAQVVGWTLASEPGRIRLSPAASR